MNEYATLLLVFWLRRLGQYCKVMQKPSIVAFTTVMLLVSPFVAVVLRERPIGEHAPNGVAEFAA